MLGLIHIRGRKIWDESIAIAEHRLISRMKERCMALSQPRRGPMRSRLCSPKEAICTWMAGVREGLLFNDRDVFFVTHLQSDIRVTLLGFSDSVTDAPPDA